MRKLFVTIFMVMSISLFANTELDKKGSFDVVAYIFDHVNDSHEWYFFSVSDKHIALPLPVILYSKHSGWHLFLSSKFHHQNESFQFELTKGSKDGGKILENLPDGSVYYPLDMSITKTVLGIILSVILLLIIIFKAKRRAVAHPFHTPKGSQNLVESVIVFVRNDVAKPFIGIGYERFMPFLLSIFFFIILSNFMGLIVPLGLNITGDIAVTLVLALFTFIVTTINGTKQYWLHIVNPDVPWFMKLPLPLIPFIEFVGIFIKPVVLMIRLFANIFSGHIIVAVLLGLIFLMSSILNTAVGFATSIISVVFSVFILFVDLLVSFIQAYIFTLLSAMYIGMATQKSKH